MQSVELVAVCGVAFLMVFVILAFLAVIMKVIILVFPEKKGVSDTAMIAAMTATVHTVFPGAKLTKVEERK